MIGSRPVTGRGFGGLQNYLLHGRNGASPDRAVWTSTRNLATNDPEQAAQVMRATASRAPRGTETPVYHLSVSLAPGESLDRPALERVADRLLEDLGLERHQSLVVEHGDGAQQHIHLMVNRVNPDTRRVWKPWRDWYRIEQSLRSQEIELGLRVVPGRLAQVPDRDLFRGTRLSPERFAQRVRELAGEGIAKARSWQELHASMTRHGLSLQPSRSGRGLVVSDGRQYTAASKIMRGASRPKLEARLGPYEAVSPDLKRLQEVSKALERRSRLERMRTRFGGANRDVAVKLRDYGQRVKKLEQASQRLDKVLGHAYQNPAAARRRIVRSLDRGGASDTAESLRKRPATYGKLHGRPMSSERGEARQAARVQAPQVLRDYERARFVERKYLQRLTEHRRNPEHSILGAARRAHGILSRALQRLDRIDQRHASYDRLGKQAASLVQRLGWKAVSHLIPHSAYGALRIAVSLAKAPARMIDKGMDRGLER